MELQHIAAVRYRGSLREAAALPGRFLPELGRFGNEAAFFHFSTNLLARGGVARPHGLAPAPGVAPARTPKSFVLIEALFRSQGEGTAAEEGCVDGGQFRERVGEA